MIYCWLDVKSTRFIRVWQVYVGKWAKMTTNKMFVQYISSVQKCHIDMTLNKYFRYFYESEMYDDEEYKQRRVRQKWHK